MKIAYFDLIGGASGDMILAAMLDAGLPFDLLQDGLAGLNLPGFTIRPKKTSKNGFQATQVEVEITDTATERHLAEILSIIADCGLPNSIKTRANHIFGRIGEIEANIHGVGMDEVHLHELGGIDTIVDVTGALLGLEFLNIDRVYCSPFPVGRGFIKGSHGLIPLPSPATVALLKGAPLRSSEIEKELVTPTGAAILTALTTSYGSVPDMTLLEVGYGAGGRDLPIPNLLRIFLGENETESGIRVETLIILETNIDDLNPQIYDYLMDRLFANGALDVTLTPIQMKKNRPAVQVSILCRQEAYKNLQSILFAETSTLGIRKSFVERYALPREFRTVTTMYGEVRVKTTEYAPGEKRVAPEYEDCRKLAEKHGVPLISVYKAALQKIE